MDYIIILLLVAYNITSHLDPDASSASDSNQGCFFEKDTRRVVSEGSIRQRRTTSLRIVSMYVGFLLPHHRCQNMGRVPNIF